MCPEDIVVGGVYEGGRSAAKRYVVSWCPNPDFLWWCAGNFKQADSVRATRIRSFAKWAARRVEREEQSK